jgi:hypothetical protein
MQVDVWAFLNQPSVRRKVCTLMTGRPDPSCGLLDSTEHTSTIAAAHRQLVEIQMLHKMEQDDVVSLAKLALLLPEARHDLTVRRDPLRPVDSIRLSWRVQHVPKLVGKEGPLPVVQKLGWDLFLVGAKRNVSMTLKHLLS